MTSILRIQTDGNHKNQEYKMFQYLNYFFASITTVDSNIITDKLIQIKREWKMKRVKLNMVGIM